MRLKFFAHDFTFGKKLSKFNQAYMKFLLQKDEILWRKYDKLNCSIQTQTK